MGEEDLVGDIEFDCPRCASRVSARFWGPCEACRSELTSSIAGEAHQIESARFEPSSHVVPNHVATKD
jgi:hypothetical protein